MMVTTPDNTRKILTTLLVMVLSSLACMEQVATPTPTPSPVLPTAAATATPEPTRTPAPTATDGGEVVQTATIQATVYVRTAADPNSPEAGSLTTGAEVEIVACEGDWCEIRTNELTGYVFRGCLSDNPEGLRCEARP